MDNTLYVVVPCYNEEEVLPETSKRLRNKMRDLMDAGKISADSRVLFVNDGSRDRTWEMIRALHKADELICGISLSRNRGHQNALLAGLMTAKERADMVVSMDADLQDDIDAIDAMVDRFLEGCDIVYGVRSYRRSDSFFKRFTAEVFYKIIKTLGGEIVFNHADYRLMSRRALSALAEYGETSLFLRGIVPMLGYKTATVEYERVRRFAGESKYTVKKMLAFAGDGITSLSTKPLYAVTTAGAITILVSLAILVVFIVGAFFGRDILGWRILLFALLFVGGMILTSLGVVGGYVGKIFTEVKQRPRFFIEETLIDDA